MLPKDCREKKFCRLCKSYNLKKVIDLKKTPLANSFFNEKKYFKKEKLYPLKVNFCKNCGHIQLSHSVFANSMFKKYLYLTNTSKQNRDHFKNYAKTISERVKDKKNIKILDVASNDGTFLNFFKNKKFFKLGVDPALNLKRYAQKKGILQLVLYFNNKSSDYIKSKYGLFDVITANHVCAHVDDLRSFVSGVKGLLKFNGFFSFEVSYLGDVIRKKTFDTIYHEHLDYHSLRPLINFFKQFELEIFDFELVEAQGGSIRIYVSHEGSKKIKKTKIKKQIFLENKKYKLFEPQSYKKFEKEINITKKELLKLIKNIKNENKSIAGYGAAAKTTTLLNYFGINNKLLNFVVDDNKLKQGRYTPGTHIPIFDSEKIYIKKPDFVILLAWNYSNSIIKKHKKFLKIGGKFIVPFPKIKIISS